MFRFQCPECRFGDHEVGRLVAETQVYCVVCLEEEGRLISIHCWGTIRTSAFSRSPDCRLIGLTGALRGASVTLPPAIGRGSSSAPP